MSQADDWWARQFVEGTKKIARDYDRFGVTRDVNDLDIAFELHNELNDRYEISLDLMFFIKLGRSLLGKKQDLPK